jgi:copper chaperone CopZ
MRRLSFLTLAVLGIAALAPAVRAEETPPAPVQPPAPAPRAEPKPEPKLEAVYVEMTGAEGAEVAAIAKAVGAVDGVRSFAWTAEGTEAKVVREVGKALDRSVLDAAKAAGAATAGVVPVAATNFTFEKVLHCGGCVASVNKALLALKGVKESTVSAAKTDVTAVYDTRIVKPADIAAALAAIKKPAKPTAP